MAKILFISAAVLIGVLLSGMIAISLLPERKGFKYTVNEGGLMPLEHSIAINASADRIWGFLEDIESNYKPWHPEDHRFFSWDSGPPLAKGSRFTSEQAMSSETVTYKGSVAESIVNRKISLGFSFPVSLLSPKIEWIIESEGDRSTFTAVTYMRTPKLFRVLFHGRIESFIEDHDMHVAAEARNMKRLLEAGQKETDHE